MTVKINGENLSRRFEMMVAKKNRGGKNLKLINARNKNGW